MDSGSKSAGKKPRAGGPSGAGEEQDAALQYQ